ncbi:MAG: hypothetical protein ABIY52_09325, partial [Gemmatimonadaceae bacterium]
RYVEKALAEQRAGTALPFATIERSTGSVVGTTRFRNAVAEHARVEIGGGGRHTAASHDQP